MSQALVLFLLFYSAFAIGMARVFAKSLMNKVASKTYVFIMLLNSLIFTIPVLIIESKDIIPIPLTYYPYIILAGVIWYYANLVGVKSMIAADVTLREPLIQTRNIFVLILGVLLLGEEVTITNLFGICLIVLGGIVATYARNYNFKAAKIDGTILCLASAFLTGLGFVIDKYNLNFAHPALYTALMYVIPLLFMLKSTKIYFREFFNLESIIKVRIIINNLLAASGLLAFAYGLKYTDVIIAYPIQSLSFVFVFIGGYFILGERTNFKNRLIGGIIALIGAVVMKVFG